MSTSDPFGSPPPPDHSGIAIAADESMDWFPKHVWDEFEKGKLGAMTLLCGIEEDNREKAERMAMVALWCVQDSPQERPPMSVVVKMLEGEVEVKPPPKPFHYLYSVGNVLSPPSTSDYTKQ
ncbi:LEAF RUST 10 DISEASE-RESISTANCE LOCUS RECEPTOR-LIKE PROTEIN KINASE-like 2.1 [Camellia lanceoleosa]|uniref:LEAF RUST 10 DISEASE-RESISTANCE LOCUS RECEPTOR-LIKE PROTEIN KINASE-like 2.1 n=1 Tax=Camellia lanceoleosa TaxID=1840588 RepID=A0ACC0HKX3_9ERIC|nr:LEAF RUST 10 DISEASE-RESISTANCE LOCUS RECEPTOR-LIKE PROTEIN KINASE-like 2.1 [Camellia lanceoleosa]